MKENKNKIILTSIIILLPMAVGLILWNRLPAEVAIHFDWNNQPDGWGSKSMLVFGVPLLMLALHLLTIFLVTQDPKKQNIGDKMRNLIFWIIPVISSGMLICLYLSALGKNVDLLRVVSLSVGLLFLVIGNYMTKNHQNYTVGVVLPWTLENKENWNKTHRLAAKVFIGAGLLIALNAFWGNTIVFVMVILLTAIIPCVYSYGIYKKGD